MRVRMKTSISGTINGEPWPPPGETIDLPDVVAEKVLKSGQGEAVSGRTRSAAPTDDKS